MRRKDARANVRNHLNRDWSVNRGIPNSTTAESLLSRHLLYYAARNQSPDVFTSIKRSPPFKRPLFISQKTGQLMSVELHLLSPEHRGHEE